MQIDNLSELPKDKIPSDKLIWDEAPEEMEYWLEKIVAGKAQPAVEIDLDEVE